MLAARGAHATYYGFNFGHDVTGNFVTGSNGTDAGYFRVTSLYLSPVTFTDLTATSFAPDAAHNPTSHQFENYTGDIFNEDFGTFRTRDFVVYDASFENGSIALVGELLPYGPDFQLNKSLTIVSSSLDAPVPESASMLLSAVGVPAILSVRRRSPPPVVTSTLG